MTKKTKLRGYELFAFKELEDFILTLDNLEDMPSNKLVAHFLLLKDSSFDRNKQLFIYNTRTNNLIGSIGFRRDGDYNLTHTIVRYRRNSWYSGAITAIKRSTYLRSVRCMPSSTLGRHTGVMARARELKDYGFRRELEVLRDSIEGGAYE